jgi:cytidyltransferase-like protein
MGICNAIIVSGGFDPIHVGHIRMIRAAHELTNHYVEGSPYEEIAVIVNTDEWLIRKKGKPFMPFKERAEIVGEIQGVSRVICGRDDDDTVVENLRRIVKNNPQCRWAFGNGGDRLNNNTPEARFCREHNIELLWGLGGDKIQSSSALLEAASKK